MDAPLLLLAPTCIVPPRRTTGCPVQLQRALAADFAEHHPAGAARVVEAYYNEGGFLNMMRDMIARLGL